MSYLVAEDGRDGTDSIEPLFERLALVCDLAGRSGEMNMAIDEVLLGRLADTPLLRLYEWESPTVSFGYFGEVGAARATAEGRPIVRRWTGGGIVEHQGDVTYSLLVPRSDLRSAVGFGGGADSYRVIHAAVAEALRRAGGGVSVLVADGTETRVAGGGECFENPVAYDLIADGRKIAGGAQRRARAGLLHQGSVRNPGRQADEGVAWRERLRAVLPRVLGRHCARRVLTAEELSDARALVAAKYGRPDWRDKY